MPTKLCLNVDLAKVYDAARPRSLVTVLTWGDLVEVTEEAAGGRLPVRGFRYRTQPDGSIVPEAVPSSRSPGG
jgi:hypothetical protein